MLFLQILNLTRENYFFKPENAGNFPIYYFSTGKVICFSIEHVVLLLILNLTRE